VAEPVTTTALLGWGAEGAAQAYKYRKEALGALRRIGAILFGRKTHLVVSGMAGVGKSVLLAALNKAVIPGFELPSRSVQAEHKVIRPRLGRRNRIALTVLPGQDASERHRSARDSFHGSEPIEGIVHVVANGYTHIREPQARRQMVEANGIRTVADFRALQLQAELKDLDDTCALIRSSHQHRNRPLWMIVAATKVDLYPGELEEARQRYSRAGSGPFVERLKALEGQLGSDNFGWEAEPVCSYLQPFDWNGEVVPSACGDDRRNHLVLNLLKAIDAHCAA
jgi:hypothetical protein